MVDLGDLSGEQLRRELLAAAVQRLADANGGYVLWEQLTAVPLPDGTNLRVVDPATVRLYRLPRLVGRSMNCIVAQARTAG